ncbi:FH1/FH2 domain-containing protein 3 [Acipenser ruthenus]|uniref:FH1/FH2 domain-containing protein 3 n=1 Tax=Acipenser ruthenus TaxID=7906 RepID=A0A444U0N3_ACIRT|nr:FH1/FH2 domain-containing protein 3 [Acipenser ruthenus]
MDQSVLDREDLQKLVSLIPSEEELLLIKEAQKKNPSLTLGSAEQSLLILGSLAMEQLVGNKTFRCILATVLAIGNFLNGCKAKGFELGYLEKLPEVRDTVSRQPLLHHTCTILLESFPETTDLHSEIPALTKSARVDFSQLHSNLEQLEARCKASWEHLKVIGRREGGGRLKSQLGSFMKDSTQRVSILRAVYRRVINRFHSFLLFLGYPRSAVREMNVGRFCKTVSDFALEYRTSRAHILQRKERHREREACNGSASAIVSPSTPDGGDPALRQHQNMKEVLSTPEMSRRLDLSLPRPRHKNRESRGTGPGKLKTQGAVCVGQACNGSASAIVSPSTPDGGDPALRQHQNMKEVLSTPEMSRRLDLSLPRPRHKNRESRGTGPGKLKTHYCITRSS